MSGTSPSTCSTSRTRRCSRPACRSGYTASTAGRTRPGSSTTAGADRGLGLRRELAGGRPSDLLREHDRLGRLARVIRPHGVRVPVGIDGHADEVGEVAIAAEDVAVEAAVADVTPVHDLGADLTDRPLG